MVNDEKAEVTHGSGNVLTYLCSILQGISRKETRNILLRIAVQEICWFNNKTFRCCLLLLLQREEEEEAPPWPVY